MGETKLIRMEAMGIIVPQLPDDVVLNILSRLPVKYLIQLKCVCKPWRSFISGPQFAKLQLAQSKNNSLNCHRFLLLSVPLESVHCEDFGNDHDLDHVNHFEFPVVMKNIPGFDDKLIGDIKIGGSCDGFICVVFSNENTWETVTPQIDMKWFQYAIYAESLVLPDWYRSTNT